jgi:hypothetical protein
MSTPTAPEKLVPALAEAGWQDIATAPRDGTLIILHGEGNTGTGRWRVIESRDTLNDIDGVAQFARKYGWHSASDKNLNKIKVSHWMPLPAAPTNPETVEAQGVGKCSNRECGKPATTRYDGDDICEPCAKYCAQRDWEEQDMPGGF